MAIHIEQGLYMAVICGLMTNWIVMRTSSTMTYNVFRLQVTLLGKSILETMRQLSRQAIRLALLDACRVWGWAI